MQKRISDHIRSNVVGYVALFFALSGGAAWATHPGGANTISTEDLQNQAVTTPKIADGAVTNPKLEDLTIRENKIRGGAVTTPKIAAGAVATGKLADLAVTGPKLAGNAVDSAKVLNKSLTADDLNGVGFLQARTARLNPRVGRTAGSPLFAIGRTNLNSFCANSADGIVLGGVQVGTTDDLGPVLVTDGEGDSLDDKRRLQAEDVQFILTVRAATNGTATTVHAEEKSFAILDNDGTSASGVAAVTATPTGNCVITVHAVG